MTAHRTLLGWADDEAQRPNRNCCSRAIETWLREAAEVVRAEADHAQQIHHEVIKECRYVAENGNEGAAAMARTVLRLLDVAPTGTNDLP